MKTSGLFTTHSFKTPCKYNQPVSLIIFGDVHRDSPGHADAKWREFLAYARSRKNALFLGMGDYLDSTSTTERECLGHISNKMHETFRNDVTALQLAKVEMIGKELAFMRGRLLGLINGNHYFDFQSGFNSDQKLAEMLSCKYLGVCSLIRLYLLTSGSNEHAIDLFAHHGKGASRLIGGSLNRVAQMFEGVEADVAIMGHDHKRGAVPATPRISLVHSSKGGLKVRSRETWAVRSGSFLKSYEPGTTCYNVDDARLPSSLGWVELLITVKCVQPGFDARGKRPRTMDIGIQALV